VHSSWLLNKCWLHPKDSHSFLPTATLPSVRSLQSVSKCVHSKDIHYFLPISTLQDAHTLQLLNKCLHSKGATLPCVHSQQLMNNCIHLKDNLSFWPTSALPGVHDVHNLTSLFIPRTIYLSCPLQHFQMPIFCSSFASIRERRGRREREREEKEEIITTSHSKEGKEKQYNSIEQVMEQ